MFRDEQEWQQQIERLDIDMDMRPAFRQALHDRMLAEFENETIPSRSIGPGWFSWRTIMKSPLTKLSTAAVLAVALTIIFMGEGKSGMVLAEMLEKLARIQSYSFTQEWTIEQEAGSIQVIQSKTYISEDAGMRSDTMMGGSAIAHTYVPPQGHDIIQVLPSNKMYMKSKMSQAQMTEMQRRSDPRHWLAELDDYHTVDLGHKTEDGRALMGFEIDDPAYLAFLFERARAELWVDAETQLPVRLEIEATSADGGIKNHIVATDFDWNAELAPQVFEPNIPADYTLKANVDLSDSEANALRGLEAFATVTGGQYPSSLDLMTGVRELVMTMQFRRSLDPGAEEPEDPAIPFTSDEMAQIMSFRTTCTFFGKLKKEQSEVAYYGEKVQLSHPDKVLLRWLQSDGQFRVVFGDLRVEVLAPAVLKELEQEKAFQDVLAGPRGPLPLQSQGDSTGKRQVDQWQVKGDHAEVTSVVEFLTWPETGDLSLQLPYKNAVMLSVAAGTESLASESLGAGAFRIRLGTRKPAEMSYVWTIDLDDLKFEKGHYRAQLQTTLPVYAYKLKVAIDPNGPWVHFKDANKHGWTSFSSENPDALERFFGSCSVGIRAKQ